MTACPRLRPRLGYCKAQACGLSRGFSQLSPRRWEYCSATGASIHHSFSKVFYGHAHSHCSKLCAVAKSSRYGPVVSRGFGTCYNDTGQPTDQVSAAVPLDAFHPPLPAERSSHLEPEKHREVGGTPLSNIRHVAIASMRYVSIFVTHTNVLRSHSCNWSDSWPPKNLHHSMSK